MTGPASALRRAFSGDGNRGGRRARFLRATALALLLLFAPLLPATGSGHADNSASGGGSYEHRAAAEKSARSRFRRLEVASFLFILACGGAAILWTIRRK